jgi:hypothetical protein
VGDAHQAGLICKTRYNIPWVAEFQDPWLDNITLDRWMQDNSWGFYHKLWRRRVARRLRAIAKQADMIITESKGHRDVFRKRLKRWGGNPNKIIHAYLGCKPELFEDSKEGPYNSLLDDTTICKIGFVGEIYYGYEERARRLVASLAQLENQGISFCFISVGSEILPLLAKEYGLKQFLPVMSVPYEQALSMMASLDWGICVPSSDININSKFFDYVMQGCPVISWGCADGEMAGLTKAQQCGVVIDDRQPAAAEKILLDCIQTKIDLNDTRQPAEWYRRSRLMGNAISRMQKLL